MSEIDDFDPFTVMDPFTGLPPEQSLEDGDGFDDFDDDELELIAAQGDNVAAAEASVQIAQGQLGRRIIPVEIEGAKPYIAQQIAEGAPVDYRAAIDRFYSDNPKKKPDSRQLRREIMAAALNDANPKADTGPPGELPAGATADQKRDHRRARMAWAMEVEQGEGA